MSLRHNPVVFMALKPRLTVDELASLWLDKGLPPLLPKVHAHHITLMWKPSDEKVRDAIAAFRWSPQDTQVIVNGWLSSNRCQAFAVHLRGRAAELCENAHPHITMATAIGVPPYYSNEMLAKLDPEPLKNETFFTLECDTYVKRSHRNG